MTRRCVLYFDYKRGDVGDGDSVTMCQTTIGLNSCSSSEFAVVMAVLSATPCTWLLKKLRR